MKNYKILFIIAITNAVYAHAMYKQLSKEECEKQELKAMFHAAENNNKGSDLKIKPIDYDTYMRRLSDTQVEVDGQGSDEGRDCRYTAVKLLVASCGISVIVVLLVLSKVIHTSL